MSIKILLDTDIGSDVDDAVCLAWLLLEQQCELAGITTVTGNTPVRAALASALCTQLNQPKVPIYPGLSMPLILKDSRQPTVPQAEVLDTRQWQHTCPKSFLKHKAIAFMQDIIRSNPGEITLLAIGPLTNIAALFSIDPEIPSLLKQLVIMGGNFTPVRWHAPSGAGRVEWNIWNDPHAAQIVYRTPVALHRSIGIDVTSRVEMTPNEVRKHFSRPGLDLVLEMARVWFSGGREYVTFHDPLAAVSIFEPDICQYDTGHIAIATDGLMEGFTLFEPSSTGGTMPHQIATDVKIDTFFKRYFRNFA